MEKNSCSGLRYFSCAVIRLVAEGKSETLQTIEEQLEKHNIIAYLSEKYPDAFGVKDFAEKASVEAFFSNCVGCFDGIENRKFGLRKNDGLLLLLGVIINFASLTPILGMENAK